MKGGKWSDYPIGHCAPPGWITQPQLGLENGRLAPTGEIGLVLDLRNHRQRVQPMPSSCTSRECVVRRSHRWQLPQLGAAKRRSRRVLGEEPLRPVRRADTLARSVVLQDRCWRLPKSGDCRTFRRVPGQRSNLLHREIELAGLCACHLLRRHAVHERRGQFPHQRSPSA